MPPWFVVVALVAQAAAETVSEDHQSDRGPRRLQSGVGTLVLIDASSNTPLTSIESGSELSGYNFDFVNLDYEPASDVQSVYFDLDDGNWTRFEGRAPYALFGDLRGNYYGNSLTYGPHTLVVVEGRDSGIVEYVFNFTVSWEPGFWSFQDESGPADVRHEGAFCACGERMYMIGGRGTRHIDIYTPATNTWEATRPLSTFELSHFQCVCLFDVVWIVHAFRYWFPFEENITHVIAMNTTVDSVADLVFDEEYFFIPFDRQRGATAVASHDGCVYSVGGSENGHWNGFTSKFDRFCPMAPDADKWYAYPSSQEPAERRDHAGAAAIGRYLYVVAGRQSDWINSAGFDDEIRTIDRFDFITETWTHISTPLLPTRRGGVAAVGFLGKVLIMGGETQDTNDALNTVEAFNPETGLYETFPGMNCERHGFGATVYQNAVYAAGGAMDRGGSPETVCLERLGVKMIGDDEPSGICALVVDGDSGRENANRCSSAVFNDVQDEDEIFVNATERVAGVSCCEIESSQATNYCPSGVCELVDFATADYKCRLLGQRLCTPEELRSAVASRAGCRYAFSHVWSSQVGGCETGATVVPSSLPLPQPTAVPAPAPTAVPAPAPTVSLEPTPVPSSPTSGPTSAPWPSPTPAPFSGCAYIVDGSTITGRDGRCPDRVYSDRYEPDVLLVDPAARVAGLRCCNIQGTQGFSYCPQGNCQLFTRAEAEARCLLEGHRLCSVQEILDGVTRNTGCQYNSLHVWANGTDDCPSPPTCAFVVDGDSDDEGASACGLFDDVADDDVLSVDTASAVAGIRCCGGLDHIASYCPGGTCGLVDFATARAECWAHDLRLCTVDEIQERAGQGSSGACDHNRTHVWSDDAAPDDCLL